MAGEIKKNSPGCNCCGEAGLDVYTVHGRATDGEGYVTHRKQTESFVASWKIDEQYHSVSIIACDDSGNMYIGMNRASGAPFLIAKYNSSGVQQWTASGAVGTATTQYVTALCVDLSGNVYVTYYPTGFEQWDATGATQWHKTMSLLGYNLAVDGSGDILFADGTNVDKYNTAGTQQWTQMIASAVNINMVADSNDDFYIQTLGTLSKYDSSGTEITAGAWPMTYSAAGLTIGPSDDIYGSKSSEIKQFDSTGALQATLSDSHIQSSGGSRAPIYVVSSDDLYVPWQEGTGSTTYYLARIKMDGTILGRSMLYGSVTGITKMPGSYVPFVAP